MTLDSTVFYAVVSGQEGSLEVLVNDTHNLTADDDLDHLKISDFVERIDCRGEYKIRGAYVPLRDKPPGKRLETAFGTEDFECVRQWQTLRSVYKPDKRVPLRLVFHIAQKAPRDELEEYFSESIADTDRSFKRCRRLIATSADPTFVTSYHDIQRSEFPILDGRIPSYGGTDTTAPPIELYHPVFAQFTRLNQDTTLSPPPEFIKQVGVLFLELSKIYTHKNGWRRDDQVCKTLAALLDVTLEKVMGGDWACTDYMALQQTPLGIRAGPLFVTFDNELGQDAPTGTDASVQVAQAYSKFHASEKVSALLNASPCPSFLIGLAGPWITILGAVFTTHVIAQRLTGYEWHGIRGPQDDTPIFTAARRLYALLLCIADLRTHYSEFQPPHYDARRNARTQTLHPRFFPSITSYTASNDEQIRFRYVRPLEPGPACMVFLAKRCDTNEDIVVKFACVYGADAHKWMADAHFAPKLEACQELGKNKGYGDLKIIVMDFVQGRTFFDRYGPTAPIPGDVIEAVDRARDRLRQGRFILPDLRRPNLMWVEEDRDHPLRIVDFDWACKEGDGARYGFHLSEELKQKSRANDYDEISVEHEHNLYRNL